MRKSLSILLAITLVFSMFGSLAFAAELTAQQKYDALAAKGIFAGMADGSAGLDLPMNRAQFARVAALILGLEGVGTPDTKVVTVAPFTDVELGLWYTEEIAAVKEANLFVGNGDGTFTPTDNISVQELAVVVATLLGLEKVEGATVEGAAAFAGPFIQAIINAGLDFPTNYTEDAIRSDLASMAFIADALINPAAATSIASAAAIGAKKIEVKFNGAVDPAKASITVWNVNNQVNSKSITFAEDKMSAVVEFSNNLAAADYTVKVEGLTETALTATVKVEAEKVAKIEFASDKIALVRTNSMQAAVGYKVLNQYGEDVTASNTVTATASKGTSAAVNGTLTLTATSNFTLGEQVSVSLIHTNGTFATATLTVSQTAQIASIDIVKLYHAEDKTLQVGSTASEYSLVLDLKDQYGVSVTDTTYINTDVITTVSNTTAATLAGFNSTANTATFTNQTIDGSNKVVLKLAGTPTAGTSTVTIISKTTGNKDSFDVVVKDAVKVDTITLSSPAVAVAGEWVTIPYTAVDQFGAAIAHPTNAMVTSTDASGVTADPVFVKDVVKNVTDLKLNLASVTGTATVIVTVITGTNKVQQLTLNVVAPAVPTVISGVKDFDTAILKDGTVTVGVANIVVKDQYNRDITPTYTVTDGNHRVKIESSDSTKVSASGADILTGTPVMLAGAAKGSASITLKLQKYNLATTTWSDVANSSYSFTEKVVEKADIASYEATVTGTVYTTTTAAYFKALKVTGTLADGSSVTVTNSTYNYLVTVNTAAFTYDDTTGKFSAGTAFAFSGTDTSAEVAVVVTILGASSQENKVVNVKVSKSAPSTETLEVVTVTGIVTKEDANVASVTAAIVNASLETFVDNAIKAVDQYGVELTAGTEPAYTIVAGNYPTGKTYLNVVAGDTFTVTAIIGSKSISFKVIVK